MKKILFAFLLLFSIPAFADPEAGKVAPDFATIDNTGQTFILSKQKGRIVVLEWYNPNCPFTRAHYDSGNMQALQEYAKDEGIIWVTIDSSAKGKEGYMTTEQAADQMDKENSKAKHLILDAHGDIAKQYAAKTTPHMFVIGPDGNIAYMGAIDDNGAAKGNEIKKSHNYVESAITALLAGNAPEPSITKPYGCAIKYEDQQ